MQRSTKIILGIFSFVPLICFTIYFISFFSMWFNMMQGFTTEADPSAMEPVFTQMVGLMFVLFLGVITGIPLFITFLIFCIKDQSASESQQLLWALIIVFANILAFPIYWYIRIWSNPRFTIKEQLSSRDN